ncbi:MAG: hypothetical protein M9882_01015 [Homoserinimonas sp.]|nr:hypothetical protein [Homoserinimonas sp.]MCW5944906.1 hypothetical protein [Cryobacterium sp.]
MSTHFRLHELELHTSSGTSNYAFTAGLNIVTGSYGTGKSSMFELIKYGLGATSAEIMPAVEANLKRVTLRLTVGRTRLQIDRDFRQNRLLATFLSGTPKTEEWSVTRIKTAPLVSDRLLQLLDIPITRLARKGYGGTSVAVSFFDLFRYMYLPQADVPRSIAGHADPFLNPKRKAVLELAYGLSDELVTQHEIEIENVRREIVTAQTANGAVKTFLEASGAPDREELPSLMQEARVDLATATDGLSSTRRAAAERSALDDQRDLRERIARLRWRVASVETEVAVARAAVERGIGLLAQLEVDEHRAHQHAIATTVLSELDFEICPRCLQDLPNHVDADVCTLCGQQQHVSNVTELNPEGRLSQQRIEVEALVSTDRGHLESSFSALDESRRELAAAVDDFERQLDPELLLPSLDAVGTAAAEVERARSGVRDLERFNDQWDLYERGIDEIRELETRIGQLEEEAAAARAALKQNEFRVASLGDRFDEEIKGLGFSDYRSAGVDERTYLPHVNDEPFERLSVSGARKVLANDAYYIAMLGNSLSDPAILLPGFLMLDGPRTSLGTTAEDLGAGERLYYRLSLLAEAYPDAQIIIADNGLPASTAFGNTRPNVIELSYQTPLLRDVPHPGPGVPTIGQPAPI